MKFLILIHVLSAIVGVGPTFFGHVLLRRNQSPQELRHSIRVLKRLELFPKIGGSLAVLTGIALLLAQDYGKITQLWLIGSIILYVLIQIVVVGIAAPHSKRLAQWVLDPANEAVPALPGEQSQLLARVSNWFYAASALGVTLFIFMIVKPT